MSEFIGDFGGGGFGGGGFGGGDFDWGGGFSSFGTTAEPGGDSWDLGGAGSGGGGDAWDIGGFDAPEAARWDVTQPERGFFDRLGTWASSDKGGKTISALGSAAGGLGKMLGGDKTAAQPWPAMGGGGGQGAESKGAAPSNLGALIQALLAKRQAQTTAYLKPGSMEPRAMSGLLGSG
jgi:hypothetical protein